MFVSLSQCLFVFLIHVCRALYCGTTDCNLQAAVFDNIIVLQSKQTMDIPGEHDVVRSDRSLDQYDR